MVIQIFMYVYIVSLLVGNVTWCTWNTGNTCCGVCYSIHIFVWNLSNLATLFAHYVNKMYNTFIVSMDICYERKIVERKSYGCRFEVKLRNFSSIH